MQSLWMVAAGLSFALMGVCVKYGAAQFSAAELVFYRALVQTAGAWVLLTHQGLSVRTTRLGMHVHRGVAGFVSLFTFFYALTSLPVATAMTLRVAVATRACNASASSAKVASATSPCAVIDFVIASK